MQTEDSEYVRLVSLISGLWDKAKNDAALAVNTELLDASWETGRYIVEFEQGRKAKARYGEQLISNLAMDLTRMRGRGFSRSNLMYMRKFYGYLYSTYFPDLLINRHVLSILTQASPLLN